VLPSAGGLDRNIALELCRVTEAAALASARWMGRGDKNAVSRCRAGNPVAETCDSCDQNRAAYE